MKRPTPILTPRFGNHELKGARSQRHFCCKLHVCDRSPAQYCPGVMQRLSVAITGKADLSLPIFIAPQL